MDFWAVADKYGLEIAMLLFGVVALYFDWVVSGKRYRRVLRERDQLFQLVVRGTHTTERTAHTAERAIEILAHREGNAGDGDTDDP